MDEQRQWYVKYRTPVGIKAAIVCGKRFELPNDTVKVGQEVEIPREFWGLNLEQYIDYFERGVKPHVKRK